MMAVLRVRVETVGGCGNGCGCVQAWVPASNRGSCLVDASRIEQSRDERGSSIQIHEDLQILRPVCESLSLFAIDVK
jgi:hypothetical protein